MPVANVMISYRATEAEPANELFELLKQRGFSPWLDRQGIRPGEPWRKQLLVQLTTCDAMVPMISRAYLASEHCRMELFVARSRGCPVVPILLEDCFDLFQQHEETKGLGDLFMARVGTLRNVGMGATREELLERVVDALRDAGTPCPPKTVYVSYSNELGAQATRIARHLQKEGISAWVATQDCRVGDNWRQAQAKGLMQARCHVLVMDKEVVKSEVLRTELLLGEAFGLPIYPVLDQDLASSFQDLSRVMEQLRVGDQTYSRIAAMQPFQPDDYEGIRAAAAKHVE